VILAAEWEAERCSVCTAPKWTNRPFCRLCSIRLQRIGLMQGLKVFCGHPLEDFIHREKLLRRWRCCYDRARDYLIVSKLLKETKR